MIVSTLIIGSVAALFAGMAQSTIGFGMAMIMAPCIMLVMEPVAVVPTILLVNILNSLVVALRYRHFARLPLLIPLSIGGIVGFSFGIHVLAQMDPRYIRLLVGILVLVFTAVLWSGWRKPLPENPWTIIPVGLISGFAGGTTSMSGPPVILFLANQGMSRDVFRANLICYFTITNIYGIARFAWMGAMTNEVLRYAAIFIPATLAGTAIGLLLGERIPEKKFRKTVFVVLVIIGCMLIVNNLRG